MHIFIFKRRTLYITLALIVILISALLFWFFTRDKAVGNHSAIKYTYANILPEEAKELVDGNPNIIILDVRSEDDYNRGHLENAFLVPFRDLRGVMSDLDEDNIYLIYCNNGKDSQRASKLLSESGYARIYSLVGGYKAWPYEITKPVIKSD